LPNKNRKKEIVMARDINITLRLKLTIGETNLNEIVYGLKEIRDGLMLQILEQILKSCDDLISVRLSHTEVYPSKTRKGLGRYARKDDPNGRLCRGRKVYKRGYRQEPRKIVGKGASHLIRSKDREK
jgi:hypothetical protein